MQKKHEYAPQNLHKGKEEEGIQAPKLIILTCKKWTEIGRVWEDLQSNVVFSFGWRKAQVELCYFGEFLMVNSSAK